MEWRPGTILFSIQTTSLSMFKYLRMLPQKKTKSHFLIVCPPKKPFFRENSFKANQGHLNKSSLYIVILQEKNPGPIPFSIY